MTTKRNLSLRDGEGQQRRRRNVLVYFFSARGTVGAMMMMVVVLMMAMILLSPHPVFARAGAAEEEDVKLRARLYAAKVKSMFQHAFDGYKTFAFPADELKPVSKKPTNTLQELGANAQDRQYFNKEYDGLAMSLIESLSTLAVMGNGEEFTKSVDWLSKHWMERLERNSRNMRVNVFEANIRILGGLLSGHVLASGNEGVRKWSKEMYREVSTSAHFNSVCFGNVGEEGMYKNGEKREYDGSLLRMAKTFGEMLLKSFEEDDVKKVNRKVKATKLPYGWVNLEHGPVREKPNTNVAAIGTLALEFGTLSRLTGDKRFEEKAKEAMLDLWSRRNVRTNLLGSIINVETGKWVDSVGGIGANGDSFHEYALKSYLMFGDEEYLEIFVPAYKAVMKYYHKSSGWFSDAEMNTGDDRHHQLTALQKFWPGLQAMIGDVERARSSHTLMMNVWVKYGMSPERYMIADDVLHSTERGYYLRPELSESTSFLYKATRDKRYLRDGRIIVEDLIKHSKVPGGFTTVDDALTKKKSDHMPSYFLSETLKYLYLLFTDFQFLKVDGSSGENQTPTSKEIIFTTEGHLLPAYRECPYVQDESNGMENVVEKRTREVGVRLGFFQKTEGEVVKRPPVGSDEWEKLDQSDQGEDDATRIMLETLAKIAKAERARNEKNVRKREERKLMGVEGEYEWWDSDGGDDDNNDDEKRENEEGDDTTTTDKHNVQIIGLDDDDETPEKRERAKKIREAILNHIEEQQREVIKKREEEQKLVEEQQKLVEAQQLEEERKAQEREEKRKLQMEKRQEQELLSQRQYLQEQKAKLELEEYQKSVPYSHQFLYRLDVRERFKKTKGTESSCHVLDENADHSCTMILECGVNAVSCAQRVCDSSLGTCV